MPSVLHLSARWNASQVRRRISKCHCHLQFNVTTAAWAGSTSLIGPIFQFTDIPIPIWSYLRDFLFTRKPPQPSRISECVRLPRQVKRRLKFILTFCVTHPSPVPNGDNSFTCKKIFFRCDFVWSFIFDRRKLQLKIDAKWIFDHIFIRLVYLALLS